MRNRISVKIRIQNGTPLDYKILEKEMLKLDFKKAIPKTKKYLHPSGKAEFIKIAYGSLNDTLLKIQLQIKNAAGKTGNHWAYILSNEETPLRKNHSLKKEEDDIPCLEIREPLFSNGVIFIIT